MAISAPSLRLIGLFGGTFDPIHIGHLRMALELKQHLDMDEMRLLPCHVPPHRARPGAGAEQRASMTELAVAECPDLTVDRRELATTEPSYSYHTLQSLRRELGDQVSLCLSMGMDSLASLHTWYRWDELLDMAHIAVAARPGWELPEEGPVGDYLKNHRGARSDLRRRPAGTLVIEELTRLPISSTDIRGQIARGESPQFLLPDSVWAYILRHDLYREPQGSGSPE